MSQIIESPGTEIKLNSNDDNKKKYAQWVRKTYDSMIRNSFSVTNSNYSKTAIQREYDRDDVIVLSPPVDVDKIISKIKLEKRLDLSNYGDENSILVICRIEPSKRIENAIYLAKLLKERKIKTKINIVGSHEPFYQKYYYDLIKLMSEYDVSDLVDFHIDASFEELVDLMKKSKIFFHPREGEHFGMSIVEAMSAGLIPIVPAIGGQSEFVPGQYHYKSLDEAVQIVSSILLDMPTEQLVKESNKMRDIAKNFSETNYKRQFQSIVSQLLYVKP
jgi:glycosyltransferase involved in cell wall biosynthesis